jgi:hypothetical protein
MSVILPGRYAQNFYSKALRSVVSSWTNQLICAQWYTCRQPSPGTDAVAGLYNLKPWGSDAPWSRCLLRWITCELLCIKLIEIIIRCHPAEHIQASLKIPWSFIKLPFCEQLLCFRILRKLGEAHPILWDFVAYQIHVTSWPKYKWLIYNLPKAWASSTVCLKHSYYNQRWEECINDLTEQIEDEGIPLS